MLGVLAFFAEMAVFVLLAIAGWHLVNGFGLRLAMACLLPVVAMVAWGQQLAPRSPLRLPQPLRVVTQLVVFATSGLLATAAHLGPVEWVVPLVACLVFGAVFVTERHTTVSS